VDVKLVQRLINARSKEEKNAVVSVLNEFFKLTDEGWQQGRCDHEIARFKDRQNKARRSAEGRWQSTLNDVVRPEISEQKGCDRNANALPTQCSPNTIHQTPNTNLHTPDKQNNGAEVGKNSSIGQNERQKILDLFSRHGVNLAKDDVKVVQLTTLNATERELNEAISQAKETRRRAASTTPINAGFVLAILKGMRRAKPTEPVEDVWWKSNAGIDDKGRELGMRAQGSESYDAFKTRIFAELRKRQELANAG
jgi:uncharacterized protein YdaU (DUF1376 family)